VTNQAFFMINWRAFWYY